MLNKPTAMLPVEGNIAFRDMPVSYKFPDKGYRLTGRYRKSGKAEMKAVEVELPFVREDKLAYFYIRCSNESDESEIIRILLSVFASGAFRDVLSPTDRPANRSSTSYHREIPSIDNPRNKGGIKRE